MSKHPDQLYFENKNIWTLFSYVSIYPSKYLCFRKEKLQIASLASEITICSRIKTAEPLSEFLTFLTFISFNNKCVILNYVKILMTIRDSYVGMNVSFYAHPGSNTRVTS
jgi:hypothetical protein